MLKILWGLFRSAVVAALAGLALDSVFEFSVRQSIGISVILFFLVRSVESLFQAFNFKPYAMRLEIHLPVLFTDLGLINTPADWSQFREKAQAEGMDHERFKIYALSPWLFATNDKYGPYARKVGIRRQVSQIAVPRTPESYPSEARRVPEIQFLQWRYWFVLQVVVPEDWEQEIRARFPGAKVSAEYGEYDKVGVSVIMAAFPSRYLRHVIDYYEPFNLLWNWRDRRFLKWFRARGWDRGDKSPQFIEHKYLSVSFDCEMD